MNLKLVNQLRKQKGLKVKELAQISGVPIGTLNKLINGQTENPSFSTALALARALGCTVNDFCDDEVDANYDLYRALPEELQTLVKKWEELSEENRLMIIGMIDLKLFEQGKMS
jgi:transcriptional regulator with XRE-family HTH domain